MRWNELRLSPLRMQKLSFLAEIYHILTRRAIPKLIINIITVKL